MKTSGSPISFIKTASLRTVLAFTLCGYLHAANIWDAGGGSNRNINTATN
ncbi:MAG: hypothetical protein ACKOAS_02430 [Verrucomicrobiota bacterium]